MHVYVVERMKAEPIEVSSAQIVKLGISKLELIGSVEDDA